MLSTRSIALGLTLAAVGFAPAAAVAKNGADDPASHAGDDKGAAVEPGDDRGAAVEPGDDKGGLRGDASRGGGSRAKRVKGSCTGRSSAKLKVKRSNGRLETEFEVDQNRSGVRWDVRMRRDGRSVVHTRATTKAPSGSFSVERRLGDPAGRDRIVAKATSPSGEVCRASLTV
jgi:hypothetical protein